MTERIETHEIAPGGLVALTIPAGDIRCKEGPEGTVVIAMSGNADALDALDVDASPEAIAVRATAAKRRRWVRGGSIDTVVTMPRDLDLTIDLGAGDIAVMGVAVRDIEVQLGSGDIRIDDVSGTTEVRVGAGDVRLGGLSGLAKVASAAGDVRVDAMSEITVSTAAGDVYLGDVSEAARIKSATGDIRVRRFAGSDLEIKTMSGDIGIGLVSGMVVKAAVKTLSGDFRNRIEPTPGPRVGSMNLTVNSFSGDVTLRTAK